MKITTKLAYRQVVKNKKKNLPIMISIFLATFLLVNLFGLYRSFTEMMLEDIYVTEGSFHAYAKNMEQEQVKKIKESSYVEQAGKEAFLSFAFLKDYQGEKLEQAQKMKIEVMDAAGMELNSVRLLSGRLPVKEKEILISSGCQINKEYAYKRVELNSNISLYREDGSAQEYTVVGILDNFDAGDTEQVYSAVLYSDDITADSVTVYIKAKTFNGIHKNIRHIASELGLNPDKDIYENGSRRRALSEEAENYRIVENSALLTMLKEGPVKESNQAILYTTFFLILFVTFIAVLLISNTFSISLRSRIRQNGLLKTCGFTPGMMRLCVLKESLFLSFPAIFLAVFFAYFSQYGTEVFIQSMRTRELENLEFRISFLVLGLSILLILGVVLVATMIPVWKVGRISPKDALTGDVHLKYNKKRKKKSSDLPAEVLIGVRNSFRQKGRFFLTVSSLAVSVLFFITFLSFEEGMQKNLVESVADIPSAEFIMAANKTPSNEFFREMPYVSYCQISYSTRADFIIPPEMKNKELISYYLMYDYQKNIDLEELFNEPETNLEVEGIDKIKYEELEWLEGEKLTYEEWVKSGTCLLQDICITRDEDNKRKINYVLKHRLNQDKFTYKKFDEVPGSWEGYEAGELMPSARVIWRPDNYNEGWLNSHLYIPIESHLKRFGKNTIWMGINVNAEKGKEQELREWLQANALKYEINVDDRVQLYLDANDSKTLMTTVLLAVLLLVVGISVINTYNTMKMNLETRQKENAILRALGMTQGQLNQMVIVESGMYVIFSCLIGDVLSVLLLEKLLQLLSGAVGIQMVIPFDYMGIAFFGVLFICILSSLAAVKGRKANTIAVQMGRQE